eukprot:GHVR01004506.1.p1 GENE.GHVR01004506.1~~GHVR01004506.1.p1  ORF type:complete len:322 (+),score=29.95 GHVR01004506.1:453-1418(+)
MALCLADSLIAASTGRAATSCCSRANVDESPMSDVAMGGCGTDSEKGSPKCKTVPFLGRQYCVTHELNTNSQEIPGDDPLFDPFDLRHRFALWWFLGYNNAFGRDDKRDSGKGSVGLGCSISMSVDEFIRNPFKNQNGFTEEGDARTSGNGSLMRLAPVALRWWSDIDTAMKFAEANSKTTHRGTEAADCCRLLAFILCKAINLQENPSDAKTFLSVLSSFEAKESSVGCLASSMQEEGPEEEIADRDWRWRANSYKYSPTRSLEKPGYVGSYCMDALAMALHCVHSTSSFKDAVLKAASMRGDADTVAAITGTPFSHILV